MIREVEIDFRRNADDRNEEGQRVRQNDDPMISGGDDSCLQTKEGDSGHDERDEPNDLIIRLFEADNLFQMLFDENDVENRKIHTIESDLNEDSVNGGKLREEKILKAEVRRYRRVLQTKTDGRTKQTLRNACLNTKSPLWEVDFSKR